MLLSLRLLRSKSRTKGVHLAHGTSKSLRMKLSRHTKKGGLVEKEFVLVICSCGESKQITRAFTITRCNNGCVNLEEILLCHKFLQGQGSATSSAHDSTKSTSTRTKMGNFSK